MLTVNTNVSSLNAQNQLRNSTNALNTSFERLSSGKKINSAADDAAGFITSQKMTSQINGLNRAAQNANDGISVVQTAEGALDEISNNLQSMRTLAVQAQDGAHNSADKIAMSVEMTTLATEISRIANATEFNGKKLLEGNFSTSFLVNSENGDENRIAVKINDMDATALGVDGTVTATVADASAALSSIDTALSSVNSQRANLGSIENRFQSSIRNLSNVETNTSAARSRIEDTDFASETASLTKNQILQQASQSILGQANQAPNAALSLLG